MKKLSPRDREFRWYKYDQEGLKRGETWFLEVGCGSRVFLGVFRLFFGGVLDCNFFGESAAECEYPANPG